MTKAQRIAEIIETECKLMTTAEVVRLFRDRNMLKDLEASLEHLSTGWQLAILTVLGLKAVPTTYLERDEMIDAEVLDADIFQ